MNRTKNAMFNREVYEAAHFVDGEKREEGRARRTRRHEGCVAKMIRALRANRRLELLARVLPPVYLRSCRHEGLYTLSLRESGGSGRDSRTERSPISERERDEGKRRSERRSGTARVYTGFVKSLLDRRIKFHRRRRDINCQSATAQPTTSSSAPGHVHTAHSRSNFSRSLET